MPQATIKEQVRRLAEELPDEADWDEVMYQVYVRQSVEAGLRDVREGRTQSSDEVRRRLGLSP